MRLSWEVPGHTALSWAWTPNRRRPGQVRGRTPGLLRARAVGRVSPCLYASAARRCPVLRARSHEGKREDLSAVQLRALRAAGTHLQRLRPGQPLLRGGMCGATPARVVAACRPTLPTQLPRGVCACRPAERLARAPGARSDASRFHPQRGLGHSSKQLDSDHDPGDPCRHRLLGTASAQRGAPCAVPSARCRPCSWQGRIELQFLLACTAGLRTAGCTARGSVSEVTHNDLARP